MSKSIDTNTPDDQKGRDHMVAILRAHIERIEKREEDVVGVFVTTISYKEDDPNEPGVMEGKAVSDLVNHPQFSEPVLRKTFDALLKHVHNIDVETIYIGEKG